ncbi:MAG: M20/M25/M40 family metallo-hydrolase [Clostridiales bacterium]|jgi:carboxypeptidase PM20D1|nr:M20/M25/M40 family metallo-hydrolase [Clostridiales bacterium]
MDEIIVSDEAIRRLSRAIQIQTVSEARYEETDFKPFDEYITFLTEAYPLFFSTCEFTRISDYALLFCWKGKSAENPILLMAHYDVVPATESDWKYPAFSGELAEGTVWGRGTLDIKSQMLAHIEAAEALIGNGYVPKNDVWFAYGHDEEVGGGHGAKQIVAYLEKRGIRFSGVLDEGGIVLNGALKGVKPPVALVGVGEKGRTDYVITVKGKGGHASMPPKSTALGQLCEVIRRIEKNPLPARITSPVAQMLEKLAPEMGAATLFAVKNRGILGKVLTSTLSKSPETNAMIRTTFAATMAKGASASNILPSEATAIIDTRLLPGDTADSVEAHFRKLAGDIPVEITRAYQSEASNISPTSGTFYQRIEALAERFFPGAVVSPYLVLGGTDSRNYERVSDYIYRFTPLLVTNEEKNTVHNSNERISVENYTRMIEFFKELIKSDDSH